MIMRIFSLFIATLLTTGMLSAADPEFYGSLLAAQNQKNPRIRAGLIVSALEINRMPVSDPNALNMLDRAFAGNGFDRKLLQRIFNLLPQRKVDIQLASFANRYALSNDFYSQELAKNLISCIKSLNFPTLSKPEQKEAADILYSALCELILDDSLREYCAQITDDICKKYPDNIPLLKTKTSIDLICCFRQHNTAPLMKNFTAIPENDFWKSRINAVTGKTGQIIPYNAGDAQDIIRMMISLKHPDCPAKLQEFARKFPDPLWSEISSLTALQYKQKDLFIPGNSAYSNFRSYLRISSFRNAKRIIKSFAPQAGFECTLMLKTAKGEHQEVIKMLKTPPVPLDKLYPGIFSHIGRSLHVAKDLPLINSIVDILLDQMREKGSTDPFSCNSVGYIAADLNIKLAEAEKLIRHAVIIYPRVASFRDSLAWVLYRQGKFAEAEKEIDTAIRFREISASVSILYLHAAQIKLALNKCDEAKKCLEIAKNIYDPDNPVCDEYDTECQQRLEKLLQ